MQARTKHFIMLAGCWAVLLWTAGPVWAQASSAANGVLSSGPTAPHSRNPARRPNPATPPPSTIQAGPHGTGAGTTSLASMGPPRPIVIGPASHSLDQRMSRKITLDVRDMSLVDIIRFLALKGDFNVVISSAIQGRATFYLKSVSIKDALDIAVLTNNLAYVIDKGIIRVMTGQEYQATYGKPFDDKRVVKIVRLQYAKPTYVLATLNDLKSSLGRIIIDEDTGTVVMIDTQQSIDRMVKAIHQIERPLKTIVYRLQYAKADVVAQQLKARIDSNAVGSINVDDRDNQLIIRAFPERRKEVVQLLKQLDVPTKEVLVEARVMQIDFKPEEDYGIDWSLAFQNSSISALRKLSFSNITLNKSNLTSSDPLYSKYGQIAVGNINVDQFATAIRALKQVSDTKILSNPQILVTNNKEAKIHIGDTVPYIISTTSGTGDNAITSEDVKFVDVGLLLTVTPTINDDGFVTMALQPEISTVVGKIASKGGGIPQVNKTLVQTTVMVKDGQTIVLGGLKKESKVKTTQGVPMLMNIPILGNFFKSNSDNMEATEIVIFITPHIVTGTENYDAYKGTVKPPEHYSGNRLKHMAQEVAPAEQLQLKN